MKTNSHSSCQFTSEHILVCGNNSYGKEYCSYHKKIIDGQIEPYDNHELNDGMPDLIIK